MIIPLRCLLVGIALQPLAACAHPAPASAVAPDAFVRIVPSTGEVVGLAVDSVTGDPLSHALVIANRIDGYSDSDKVAADYFGVFRMHPLPAGHYRLKVLYIGYTPRTLNVTLPLPPNVILLAALDPEHCERYIDLVQCTPEQTQWAKMETARRILEEWHGDLVFVAPDGSVPNEDSVIAGIRDSLGSGAANVLIDIIRGRDSYRRKAIAATVYSRLGFKEAPLEDILNSVTLRDEESVATASAAFRGIVKQDGMTKSVSQARAAYIRRASRLIVSDSAPNGLPPELRFAIVLLKVESIGGNPLACDLLKSPEVKLAMTWLVEHGYEIGVNPSLGYSCG